MDLLNISRILAQGGSIWCVFEGLRLWGARSVMFYEGLRLLEAHLYVFYVSGRLSGGRMSNDAKGPYETRWVR